MYAASSDGNVFCSAKEMLKRLLPVTLSQGIFRTHTHTHAHAQATRYSHPGQIHVQCLRRALVILTNAKDYCGNFA